MVPPIWLKICLGLRSPGGRKKGLALVALLLWYQNREPWRSFVPLLMETLTAAPPAKPVSASKELVVMLTVSIDSSAGV